MGNRWSHTICRLQVHLKALGQIGFVLMKVQCRSAITDCMDPNKNPTFLQVINDPVSGVFTHHYGNNHPPRCTTLLGTLPYVPILTLLYLRLRYDPGQATCTLRQAIGDELTAFLSERFASNKNLNTHFVNRPLVSVNFTATGCR